jgi:hypothetical protein
VAIISVKPGEALVLAGLAPASTAHRIAAVRITRGTYPFPLRSVPGYSRRKVVLVSDIEATVRGHASTGARGVAPSRGRPRKALAAKATESQGEGP